MTDDTIELTVEAGDASDEVAVPRALFDMLREGEEDDAHIAGDLLVLHCAQRLHTMVHHSEGAEPAVEDAEATAMELFEERFGTSFAEATGHSH